VCVRHIFVCQAHKGCVHGLGVTIYNCFYSERSIDCSLQCYTLYKDCTSNCNVILEGDVLCGFKNPQMMILESSIYMHNDQALKLL
jgi:hypothetical protein